MPKQFAAASCKNICTSLTAASAAGAAAAAAATETET